jgi:hypothetical protein
MSGPNDYTKHDAREETGASHNEVKQAWHQARDDYRRDYGNLNPTENPDGADEAFGPVAGQNEDHSWTKQ